MPEMERLLVNLLEKYVVASQSCVSRVVFLPVTSLSDSEASIFDGCHLLN